MKHKHEDGFAHFLVVLVIIIVLAGVGFAAYKAVTSRNQRGQQTGQTVFNSSKDDYPNTSDAPDMKLVWDDKASIGIPSEEVTSVGQYGGWEGGGSHTAFKENQEPATEIEVRLLHKDYPLYAYLPGIIAYAQDETVSIRYGTSYALQYKHVIHIDESIKAGQKIEVGTKIGTISPDKGKGAFWEIELNRKDDNGVWSVNPVTYFDQESQASLNALLTKSNLTSWNVDSSDKKAGWIAYTDKPEMCGDPAKAGWEKVGVEDCLKQIGLDWTLNGR